MISGASFTFDLSGSVFLSPLFLCGTAALAKRWQEDGIAELELREPRDENLRDFLRTIGYPQAFWDTETSFDARRRLVKLQSRNCVPLIGFEVRKAEQRSTEMLIQAMESLLDRQCHLTGHGLMALRYITSELSGNIGIHASHGSGFILAHYRPNLHCIELAIADTGVGLLQNYLSHGHDVATDAKAMMMALNGVSTKPQAITRGFGISTSRDMLVRGMKGEFFLWSGNTCFFNNPSREKIFEMMDGTTFPGCYLALRIPTMQDPTFRWDQYAEGRSI